MLHNTCILISKTWEQNRCILLCFCYVLDGSNIVAGSSYLGAFLHGAGGQKVSSWVLGRLLNTFVRLYLKHPHLHWYLVLVSSIVELTDHFSLLCNLSTTSVRLGWDRSRGMGSLWCWVFSAFAKSDCKNYSTIIFHCRYYMSVVVTLSFLSTRLAVVNELHAKAWFNRPYDVSSLVIGSIEAFLIPAKPTFAVFCYHSELVICLVLFEVKPSDIGPKSFHTYENVEIC